MNKPGKTPVFKSFQDALARLAEERARRKQSQGYAARQEAGLREDRGQRRALEAEQRRVTARRIAAERDAQRAAAAAAPRRPATVTTPRWAAASLATVAAASLLANILQYFHYSPSRTLVRVGDRAVPQRDYLNALDAAAGRPVLEHIVYGELVRQAALRAGVFPSPAQVDARLAASGPGAAASGPGSRDSVALQLALENLRLRGITVTDAEVAAFYAAHKATLAAPPQVTASLIAAPTAAEAARAAHLLAAGRTDAQIAALPPLRAAGVGGFQVDVAALPPDLRARLERAAFGSPLGSIQTVPCPNGTFLVLRARRRSGPQTPSFAAVHDQVMRLARLQKAPSERDVMLQLYRASPPTFEMSRYAQFFAGAGAPVNGAAPPTNGAVPPARAVATVPPAGSPAAKGAD